MGESIEQILKRRATRLGLTVDQVLEHDRNSLRAHAHEHADCPTPGFLESFLEDDSVREVVIHLLTCPMCAAMVLSAEQVRKRS